MSTDTTSITNEGEKKLLEAGFEYYCCFPKADKDVGRAYNLYNVNLFRH